MLCLPFNQVSLSWKLKFDPLRDVEFVRTLNAVGVLPPMARKLNAAPPT
jgi:hypothetical protein